MGKPTICLGENKGADQLCGNREADQRLCFCYTDSTIPFLLKYKISSHEQSSVTVQPGLCQTWWEFAHAQVQLLYIMLSSFYSYLLVSLKSTLALRLRV